MNKLIILLVWLSAPSASAFLGFVRGSIIRSPVWIHENAPISRICVPVHFPHQQSSRSLSQSDSDNVGREQNTVNGRASTQRLPYNAPDWSTMVKSNFFYIDKTKAIEDLESYGLFCKLWRPRRCGKTLFCQQLALYYDVATGNEKFDELFGHTYIGKNPTAERRQYHILSLSFNSGVDSSGDVKENFRDYINVKVREFLDKYPGIGEKVVVNPTNHLSTLQRLFAAMRLADKKLYFIVDEYDAFANRLLFNIDTNASDLGRRQYESSVSSGEGVLLSFCNTLKANIDVIGRMFFTGVTPVAFADGLSSLSSVDDVSFERFFETTFGFTADEVKEILALIYPRDSVEFERTFIEMKENFDGYRFNEDQEVAVYNPQMCLYYLNKLARDGKPPEHLLDDNLAAENVAKFLKNSYRYMGAKSYASSSLNFALGIFDREIYQSFRSEDLLEDRDTVNRALVSLAFYHGFLTYADPKEQKTNKGKLVAPNLVTRKLLLDPLSRTIPDRFIVQLAEAVVKADKAAWDLVIAQMSKMAKDSIGETVTPELRRALLAFLLTANKDVWTERFKNSGG